MKLHILNAFLPILSIPLALLSIGVLAENYVPNQHDKTLGKIYVKNVKQEFGVQQVLSAEMDRNPRTNADFIYMEVEGMPCVVYTPRADAKSISCDWSRWKGSSFTETVIEHKPTQQQEAEIIRKYKQSLRNAPTKDLTPPESLRYR